MNNKEVSSTPEGQYGTAHNLKKGWVRLFTCCGDVNATAFGKWTQEDLDAYLKLLAWHFDELNPPIEMADGSILITAGEDKEPICLIDKDVFGPQE